MRIIKRKVCLFMCCICCIFGLFPTMSISAEETKTVRVGWYEDAYHITAKNGTLSGYGYEYEQAIAAYTGWKYEYVKGDWKELFEMLKHGEIDLMSAISYTDERSKDVLFSNSPMGEEKYYLYANVKDSDISDSDLSSLNGKKIIVMDQSVMADQFSQWEKENKIRTEHVNSFNFEYSQSLIKNNECDGVISTESATWGKLGLSVVAQFGVSDNYFAINKNCPDLKEDLDKAMRSMDRDKPFYADKLYQRYLDIQSTTVISKDEKEWLSEHGTIRIGYLKEDGGISTQDSNSGKLIGVINDYIDGVRGWFGKKQKFKLIGFDSQEEQIQALHNNEIDLIFHVTENPYFAEKNELALSNSVLSIPMMAITQKERFNENDKNKVAVDKNDIKLIWYISYNYPDWKMIECNSAKEAKRMVKNGKADCHVIRSGQINRYGSDKNNHIISLTKSGNSAFAVHRGNTKLLSILNKSLSSLQVNKLSGAMTYYEDSLRKTTLSDFVNDNKLLVIFFVVGIILIILFLQKARNAELKAKREANQAQLFNWKLQKSQKELNDALAQAKSANASKTIFLNNMSHDIRTPMNAIIGFTSLATSNLDDKEMLKDYLQKISVSSKHLLSLINDVLDMSRIESGKVKIEEKPVHLLELIQDINTIMQPSINEGKLDFTVDTSCVTDEYIMADPLRLTEILLNILSNSVKYNRPGGAVSLRVLQDKTSKEYAKYHFIIKDTGIGISEEFQKHIFENFAREETSTVSGIQGTGLGLAITKKIIDLMGGTIQLQSEEGMGSEFDVCLTFKLYETIESFHGLNALIVNGDTDTCLRISSMLKDLGLRCEYATFGNEAINRVKQIENVGGDFFVYIIDCQMSDMSGIEIVRQIHNRNAIVIMTKDEWVDMDKGIGVNDFWDKPLCISELKSILSKYIEIKDNKSELKELAHEGMKILLVEDNELNQEIAVEILKQAGFEVEVAENGLVAVEKMKYVKKGQYDLILMDVQMPVMNGYDATRNIRAIGNAYCKYIPIIAMTANAFEEDKEKAFHAGMNGYLPKPIDIEKMLEMIDSILRKQYYK